MDKSGSVERTPFESHGRRRENRDQNHADSHSTSSSYIAVEQQLNRLIPTTDNEDPDRLSDRSSKELNRRKAKPPILKRDKSELTKKQPPPLQSKESLKIR